MNLKVVPGNPLTGNVGSGSPHCLPGDKSISHRAALFAALAVGKSVIENFLVSGVTKAMLDALTALGVSWKLDGTTLSVSGRGFGGLSSPLAPIQCGNSATTIRLLAGALAAVGVSAELDGSPGLRARPMRRIVEPLQAMGVMVEASPTGTAPLKLASRSSGKLLIPITYTLPIASAQVKSCLLLAALAADGETILYEPGPSRDHTERMLRSMGVAVESFQRSASSSKELAVGDQYGTRISPVHPLCLAPLRMTLPGDVSAAAFLIVAVLVTPGSAITIRSVGLNPARIGLIDALRAMGADIQIIHQSEQNGEPVGDLTVHYSPLQGGRINGSLVVRMIDEFPAFAIAAVYARGKTVVSDAEELRTKESDRISSLCQEIRKLGAEVTETPDGFVVYGGQGLHGGEVQPHGDHRLAMSLLLAGLASSQPVTVQGAEIITESFPEFASILQSLGANLQFKT